jgi:hypothetical protein
MRIRFLLFSALNVRKSLPHIGYGAAREKH